MSEKPFIVQSHDIHLDSEYMEWLLEVKKRYRNAQINAAVKVNSEQLLFNWQLGRDLVLRRTEEKWGKGIVEQVSLDLQDAFPGVKGFSARNLWFMKQWYTFYSSKPEAASLVLELDEKIQVNSEKLKQVASEIQNQKLKQAASELQFPSVFGYVPWMHHVLIIQKCKTAEEAAFYIQRTLQGITTPIGVATYSNVKIEEVRAQLPTTEQIKACIELAEKEYLQSKKEAE